MADPIIPNGVRAQCIWKGDTNLPEDRFVTSWAFVRVDLANIDAQEQAEEVAERLREFWLETTASANAVASLLPETVTSQGLTIRCYDLGEAPPREPRIFNYPFAAGSSAQALPREVAIANSFYATRNLPRQRGRVFIGPLTSTSINGNSSTTIAVAPRNAITASAKRLATGAGVGDQMRWCVLSQADAELRQVTNGWVDDAFDTIRSRGLAPTTRTIWAP